MFLGRSPLSGYKGEKKIRNLVPKSSFFKTLAGKTCSAFSGESDKTNNLAKNCFLDPGRSNFAVRSRIGIERAYGRSTREGGY